MKRNLLIAVLFVSIVSMGMAETIRSVINDGATGTKSATVFVTKGEGVAKITDLATRIDDGVTTASVDIRIGKKQYAVASATSSGGTVLWFANTSTNVAVSSYVLLQDASSGTNYLRHVISATLTSVTVSEAVTPATATTDYVWALYTAIRKPVLARSQTTALSEGTVLFLPSAVPTALTIDGNTTSCSISISGARVQ